MVYILYIISSFFFTLSARAHACIVVDFSFACRVVFFIILLLFSMFHEIFFFVQFNFDNKMPIERNLTTNEIIWRFSNQV